MAMKAAGKRSQPVVPKYLCPFCNTVKFAPEFYVSSDPLVLTGKTSMCKNCAEKIARNWSDAKQEFGECTKLSVQEALERLDKPFLDSVWETSFYEFHGNHSRISSIWGVYIKNIVMPQYRAMRWRDSDIFSTYKNSAEEVAKEEVRVAAEAQRSEELQYEYDINRRDVIRMVGYDPFEKYPIEDDKPVLYAQLVSFIDDETKNDGMKMNAVIQIVQSFNQIQKLNDAINDLSSDVSKINQNNGTIKQHAETISKLLSGANALAKDNGISDIVPVPSNWFEKSPIELLEVPKVHCATA